MAKTAVLLMTLLYAGVSVPEEIPSKTPWADRDVDLYTLVQKGYEIVDTDSTIAKGLEDWEKVMMETIYLRKGKDYFRCLTREGMPGREVHGCQQLVPIKR